VHGRGRGCVLNEREPCLLVQHNTVREAHIQAAAIAACLGAEPAVIMQAAEIGIEYAIDSCAPKNIADLQTQSRSYVRSPRWARPDTLHRAKQSRG